MRVARRPVLVEEDRDTLRLPPHSIDAEQSVLGAMLLDNTIIPGVERQLKASDFYIAANGLLFEHALSLHTRNAPVDVVTLAESLKAADKLDYVGGAVYLGALLQAVPTAASALHYAGIVRERATKRAVMAIGHEIADAAAATVTPESVLLLADAQSKLQALADSSVGRCMCLPMDILAVARLPIPLRLWLVGKIMPRGVPGILTGHGGAAKTQTAIALAIALVLGIDFFGEPVTQCKVAFVSSEDDNTDLHIRLAAQCAAMGVAPASLAGGLFIYDMTKADPTLITVDDDGGVVSTPLYNQLRSELRSNGVSVVILDNWATLCAVDSIRPRQVTAALSMLARLVGEGGNVIILHHVDKATARAGYGREAYSGTAALHNRSRWRWYLFSPGRVDDAGPGDENDGAAPAEDDGRRILEVQKLNAGKVGARIPLRIVTADGPTLGAVSADGPSGGIVAWISRENERKGVLAAMAEAANLDIWIPANTNSSSTAYEALSELPGYPKELKGKSGRGRLFKLLRQLRAERAIEVYQHKTEARKQREAFRLATTTRTAA